MSTILSNASFYNEDCSDITDWTDNDLGTGASTQVTFDGKSCFKFDSGAPADPNNYARRYIDVGTFGDRVVVSLSLYCDAVGIRADSDYFYLEVQRNDVRLNARFCSDGLFIHRGESINEFGTDLVVQDTWQEWTFDIDFSTPATANVYIYLNGVLQGNADCSHTTAGTNGYVLLAQLGNTTANRISYVDWIKVGNDVLEEVYFLNRPSVIWKNRTSVLWYGGAITETVYAYEPVILVEIQLDSGNIYFATRDFYYPGTDRYYKGDLLEAPVISKELSGMYYGVEQTSPITLSFANRDITIDDTWDEIVAAEEIRGKWVMVSRYDLIDGLTYEFGGRITEYSLGEKVVLSVEIREDEILDNLLPSELVTAAGFDSTALGVGRPINICFGHCRNVPCPNICNDTQTNYYDYLIGYGVLESLWEDAPNGYGVRRSGVLVDTSEYTFYDGSQGSPYPGYAFIRFTVEQVDFSGNYYEITADVYGLEMGGVTAERNFANIIDNIISDTTWGLSGSVSSSSITTAATALNTIGNMYCDGAVTTQRTARDILDELLFTCRGTLEKGNDPEWDLIIDGTKNSEGSFGDNDGYYDNCEVLSVSCIPSGEALKSAVVHYDLQSGNPYKMGITVHGTFGIDRVYELNFVKEVLTAKKVLSYLYNRSIHSDTKVVLNVDMEGRLLRRGDVLTLTAPARGITAQDFVIDGIRRGLTDFQFECREYSSSIFDDEVITSPTVRTESLKGTSGPQSWVTSEFAVEDIGAFTADKKIKVRIDDVLYYIQLDTV